VRTRSSIAADLDLGRMLAGQSVREDTQQTPEGNTARVPTNRDLWTQKGVRTAGGESYARDPRLNTQPITARGASRVGTEGPESSASATGPAEALSTGGHGLRASSTPAHEPRRPAKKRAKSIHSTGLASKLGGQSTSRASKRPQAPGAPMPEEAALKFSTLTGYF
jgi:hypothetical protein